jgi:hypothetical protein
MVRTAWSSRLMFVVAALAMLMACGGGDRSEPRPPSDPGGDPGGGDTGGGDEPGAGGETGGEPGGGGETGSGGEPGGEAGGDGETGGGGESGGEAGGGGETGGGGESGGEAGGGGSTPPGEGGTAPPSTTPGTTVFARMLGGAGSDTAVGPLAFDADGGFVALSKFGADAPNYENFGIARFDAAGATRWSKSFRIGGTELYYEAIAISPLGNVFLGFLNEAGMDFGGGPLPYGQGVIVKLAPDGRFLWQRSFDGTPALAVDGSGSVLVATPFELVKLRWDGVELWSQPATEDAHLSSSFPRVAVDPDGNVIVGSGVFGDNQGVIRKLDPDGDVLWSHALGADVIVVDYVGTTSRGTVVVGGSFRGTLRFGGADLVSPTNDSLVGFVVVFEADGRERWGRTRPRPGPLAVDPAGRLALLDVPYSEPIGCTDELAKWDLTGKELWRRPVSSCDGAPGAGAFARGIGVAPSGAIWIQGYANRPFDLGTGVLTPEETDWWLLRVAP